MTIDFNRLGNDLQLLQPFNRGSNRTARGDLKTLQRLETDAGNQIYMDLATLSGPDNLEQALLMRLLTPVGSLEMLGHPDYGSRLYSLIGELNSETNRNRAKLYVLEAIAQEPRIGQVLSISVSTSRQGSPTEVDIAVSAQVAESKQVINLVFPFFLQ